MNNIISAEILVDVTNGESRWTCFKVRYPRFIMAEVNTHRMLSRVSASSRAIPTKKLIERVKTDPFIPIHVGANQKGMSANKEVDNETRARFIDQWKLAARSACLSAEGMERLGIHKQVINRVLEPFLTVETLIAGTEWGNFFKLRASKEAQPEFACLAYKMLDLYRESTPKESDGWCGPFMDNMPPGLSTEDKKRIAVARIARISYANFSGEININDDLRLAGQLMSNGHMSPFEFVVYPLTDTPLDSRLGSTTKIHNLTGFATFRSTIEIEHTNKLIKKITDLERPAWTI
jgi:thymidylate synthase ThyX